MGIYDPIFRIGKDFQKRKEKELEESRAKESDQDTKVNIEGSITTG